MERYNQESTRLKALHKELLTKTASFYICLMMYFDGFDVRADEIVDMMMTDKDNTATRSEIMQDIINGHHRLFDDWGFGRLFQLIGVDDDE